jgi:hypothetical protein
MQALSLLSNHELLERVRDAVKAERSSVANVILLLIELDRRRLYTGEACDSLWSYCVERLNYSNDEAEKRVRVARLASRYPAVLDELRAGSIHLTGLYMLARYVTAENRDELLALARGKSKRALEQLLAERFPKSRVPDRFHPVQEQLENAALVLGRPGTGAASNGSGAAGTAAAVTNSGTAPVPLCSDATRSAEPAGALKPLSASHWSVQFTVTREVAAKIEHAWALASHALENGSLPALFERAIDALIEKETKRRLGAGNPRARRALEPGSRRVPVDVASRVWALVFVLHTHRDQSRAGRACRIRSCARLQ